MSRLSQALAYARIKQAGLLSKRRFEAYRLVFLYPGITSGELDRKLSNETNTWTRAGSPRLNELVAVGVLSEGPLRKCSITGQMVLTYYVTGRLPAGTPKRAKKPSKEAFASLFVEIEKLLEGAAFTGYVLPADAAEALDWVLTKESR